MPIAAAEDLPIADPITAAVTAVPAAPNNNTDQLVRPVSIAGRGRISRDNNSRRRTGSRPLIHIAAVLSVAVAIAAIIFVTTREPEKALDDPDFARNESIEPASVNPMMVPDVELGPDVEDDPRIRIVESGNRPPKTPTPPISPPLIDDPTEMDPPTVAMEADPPPKAPTIEPVVPSLDPNPPSVVRAHELSGLRWTKITGVLTRQNELTPNSQSRVKSWESVHAGSEAIVDATGGQFVLRTLPLSRAEATLESGGRIVLASDSGMEVTPGDAATSANIELQHGDLALIDLPEGTLIRLVRVGHPHAVLQWQSKASAVLQYAADGLQVHVRHGTINVNQQPQQNSSVVIGQDRSVQTIDQPQRLPTWVDRPVATIQVKQTFLAQISESRNVMGTINQQVRNIAVSDRITDADLRSMSILASWQAALADEQVFRLVGHPVPVIRLAALNRIAAMPRWDPRYNRTWTSIERVVRDKQRVQRFKRLCMLSQQRAVPARRWWMRCWMIWRRAILLAAR